VDTETQITMSPSAFENVVEGQEITLELRVADVQALAAWQAELVYDPTTLRFVEFLPRDFLAASGGGVIEVAHVVENLSDTQGEPVVAQPWDVAADRQVDIDDFALVAHGFGQQGVSIPGDIDRNGIIDIVDLLTVAQHFGGGRSVPDLGVTVSQAMFAANGVSGSGSIGAVTFKVLRQRDTTVRLRNPKFLDEDLASIAVRAVDRTDINASSTPPPVTFEQRNDWVFDPAPSGNGDGQASAGERLLLKVRLRQSGTEEAQNVRVTLTVADSDVALITGMATHATWPASTARNNDGFIIEIAAHATPHDVDITVDVEADNGGPWQFSFTFPIVALPAELASRSFWMRDKSTGNANGEANPGERIEIKARLKNDGPVDAQNVVATLSSNDPDVTVVNGQVTHATWPAGVARNNDGLLVQIAAGATGSVAFTLDVTADNGGPWQFTYTLPIVPLPTTSLVSRNFWIRDKITGNADGDANAGERVEVKARLKNESDTDLVNVVAALSSDDPVTLVNWQVTHATWPAGVARNNDGLLVEIGALAADSVTFTLDVTADNGGPWQFIYTLPIAPAPVVLTSRNFWVRDKVTGNADGKANPGERVEVKVRLKNDSLVDALNVVATLSSGDDVTSVNGQVTHATWPAGVARNNDGLVLDIGAGASGSVTLTLDVTADNGGPWQFTYTLPIVALPTAGLAERSFWARDKGVGNADGDANPGERVKIKARLKNESDTAFLNVVATLSTDDPNVTFGRDSVTHATWPAGVARNNDGLDVTFGVGASGSVDFTLDVTADNGGPWQFTYTLPIVTIPPVFTFRSAWSRDKITGDDDGNAEPGERVEVRVRMKNEGQIAAENVVVTLSTVDGSVTIPSATATHASWSAGQARTNVGFLVDLGEGVGSSVAFVVDVVADNAGPWQFTFDLPVAAAAAPSALVSGRPTVSALLPNYPNPFNPETWIPFDLSEAADVTVRVYDMQGRVVRRIALGYRDTGVYRGRSAAAYWDGRNEVGEAVASGVYIYELRAGDFVERRRMVIRK
jgi:hypothetical protein